MHLVDGRQSEMRHSEVDEDLGSPYSCTAMAGHVDQVTLVTATAIEAASSYQVVAAR